MAQARRTRPTRTADPAAAAPGEPRRALAIAALAVFVVLCATAEERTLGTITDEQQMLYTAESIAEQGEIGIARGQYFAVHRAAGDAVSPYGMGLALLEAPVVTLSGAWERAFGARTSQTLFVLLQILLVTAASTLAGFLARGLGASRTGEVVAVIGTGLASPLWPATAAALSEPLQAALVVGSVLLAGRGERARAAFAAGLCTGAAVLTKPLNLPLAPFLLLPLVLDGERPPGAFFATLLARKARIALAAAGAAVPLTAWIAFEVVRFDRPLSSYAGQAFAHPPLDGLWRLLVGPNEGFLWYFPLLLLACFGVARLLGRKEARGSALAIGGTLVVLLAISSSWWAWDGTFGWGPRFLLPAIPLLAAAAGIAAEGARRVLAAGLVAAGVLVNALGALQSDSATFAYVLSTGSFAGTPEEAARIPPYFLTRGPSGQTLIPRIFVAASDAAFAPIRIAWFLLRARRAADTQGELDHRLFAAPWLVAHPEAIPRPSAPPNTTYAIQFGYLRTPFSWPFLGKALLISDEERRRLYNGAYDNALADQALRNLDLGRPGRALEPAARLFAIAPSGYSAALRLEALRGAKRAGDYGEAFGTLDPALRTSPLVALVEALAARDRGDESAARMAMAYAARSIRTPEVLKAKDAPLGEWPASFRALTANLLGREQAVEAPGARWAQ